MAGTKKFQFVMSDQLRDVLDDLRKKTGRSDYAEVLRDAVRAYAWVVQEYESGNEIMSRRPPSGERRLNGVLPFAPPKKDNDR